MGHSVLVTGIALLRQAEAERFSTMSAASYSRCPSEAKVSESPTMEFHEKIYMIEYFRCAFITRFYISKYLHEVLSSDPLKMELCLPQHPRQSSLNNWSQDQSDYNSFQGTD